MNRVHPLHRTIVALLALFALVGMAPRTASAVHVAPVERAKPVRLAEVPASTQYAQTTCPVTTTRLDVVFMIDQSGSMGDVIDAASDGARDIAAAIRGLVADTAFGVASFNDYPIAGDIYGADGDTPYTKQSEISDNLDNLQNGIDAIDLQFGGDVPEAYSRAVAESVNFNWRSGATRVVVLMGDASPHSVGSAPYDDGLPDPGRDGVPGTADDIRTFGDAVAAADANNISIAGLAFDDNTPSLAMFDFATRGNWEYYFDAGNIVQSIAARVSGAICNDRPREQAEPAYVTVVQSPTPNISVVAGDIVAINLNVVNRGAGNSSNTTITLPLSSAEVQVLDAQFSRAGAWVSSLSADAIQMQTGALAKNGDAITATLRLRVLPGVANGTALGERGTYQWVDGRSGGFGQTNLPILAVGGVNMSVQFYPFAVNTADGTNRTVAGNVFKPDEPVAFWYNTPTGAAVAVGRITADGAGTAGVVVPTTGWAAGKYSMVAQGEWSRITAVGEFEIR